MAELKNITVNISLNGQLDVEKIAEELKASIRKEVERVGVKVEVAKPYLKTEKRPARVGERILITKADPLEDEGQRYKVGDVFTVTKEGACASHDVEVAGMPSFVDYREYEVVIEDEEVAEAEAKLSPDLVPGTKVRAKFNEKIYEIESRKPSHDDSHGYEGKAYNLVEGGWLAESQFDVINEEEEKWAKIGRKPNEFKKGDIVRIIDRCCSSQVRDGDIAEVTSIDGDTTYVVGKRYNPAVRAELIAPVEARFDR